MSQVSRGYKRIAYLTGMALVLITLGIEYFQYHHNKDLMLIDLKNRLDEHTSNVNLRARTIQGYVNGLKTAAENSLFYIKTWGTTSPFFPYLKNNPERGAYYLDITNTSLNKAMVGNLTGLGKIEDLSQEIKMELNMALLLNTYFEIALRNNRGAIWVYYTSKNHFQNLYPWLPLNINPYYKTLDNKMFFQSATPERNPKGLNFWTPAYEDGSADESRYRRGVVVTNSSPVYDGDHFLGSVSLDLSLIELNRVMSRFSSSEGSLFLINKEHQVLAVKDAKPFQGEDRPILHLEQFLSPAIIDKVKQEMMDLTGWFSLEGPSIVYVIDLHEAPWFMVYVGSQSELFAQPFNEALQDILTIIALLIFVVGMSYLIAIRNFISPAQKLVDHIERENRGVKSTFKNIPSLWKPWFDIVSNIFMENRTLMVDLENRVRIRTKQLQQKNTQLEQILTDLKKAQNQIIVQEKLASLGALTAGIAHEIKNPLNFVMNFTDLSLEYLQELKEKVTNENDLFDLIEQNMIKTREHAERADSIVKGMLAHARGSTGEITSFNLNALLDEAIDLAYVGFQGKEDYFAATIIKKFDSSIGDIQGSQQDLARVFLNIVNNACFSMYQKYKTLGDTYHPELIIETKNRGDQVDIIFEDNGLGMGRKTLKKIFTPFFTTKDSGKGTGLGLSLSYDIITHQHHGHIKVESKLDHFCTFVLNLPKKG